MGEEFHVRMIDTLTIQNCNVQYVDFMIHSEIDGILLNTNVRILCLGFLPGRKINLIRAPKEQQRSRSWHRMVSRARQGVGLGMSRALLQPAACKTQFQRQ